MAKLVGISPGGYRREHTLGELCLIGRSPHAHVRLPDHSVSRHHAKITHSSSSYVIEDLASGLGTLVNRVAITVSRLRSGDEIAIGDHAFRFEEQPLSPVITADFVLTSDQPPPVEVRVDAAPDPEAVCHEETDRDQASTISRLALRLNSLLAVTRLANSSLDPDAILRELAGLCLEFVPAAQRALVVVPERGSQTLSMRAMALREGVTDRTFHIPRSVSNEVLGQGRPVLACPLTRSKDGTRPASGTALAVPLISRGVRLGLVYLDSLEPDHELTREELDIVSDMASQVALGLTNAQMVQALLRQSRTEQEMEAAKQVQKRFLPRGVPKIPGFSFVAHYDPSQDVGGDLYDFVHLDPSRVGVAIGDVSGKGFGAALVMAWVTSLLRVAAHQEKRPADVIARVNEKLLEARQDDLFVTLFYGVLDRWTQSLTFCNAGHMPPLVRRGQGGQVEQIEEGTGLPVGMLADTAFEGGRIVLGQQDTVVLVSDGVTEAQDCEGQLFGMDRLVQVMASSPSQPVEMVAGVLRELRRFVGEREQADDITIVALGVGGEMEDIRATIPPGTLFTGPGQK